MSLLIDNHTVDEVLDIEAALEVIEDAFAQLGRGEATFQGRTDIVSPTAAEGDCYAWGSMLGAIRSPPRLALRFKSDVLQWFHRDGQVIEKKFNVEPGTFMGFVLLFDTSDGALLGLVNDGQLQHVRVGATAGVACKYLARDDASSVGVLGSGGMARTYAEAFAAVRDVEELTVFSPTPEHREAYAAEMGDELGVAANPVDSAREAVRGADIVAVCTDARTPVFEQDWLEPGMFVVNTSVGEMDDRLFEMDDNVFTTVSEPFTHYMIEDDELTEERFRRNHGGGFEPLPYPTLGELVNGSVPGRRSAEDAIFHHNMSSAIQFAAVGNLVHERASERGLGTEVPLEWFQQDIRN